MKYELNTGSYIPKEKVSLLENLDCVASTEKDAINIAKALAVSCYLEDCEEYPREPESYNDNSFAIFKKVGSCDCRLSDYYIAFLDVEDGKDYYGVQFAGLCYICKKCAERPSDRDINYVEPPLPF